MADSGMIPAGADIAMHNFLSHVQKYQSQMRNVQRKGRGGISSSAARQIHAPISGRDAINSSSASS